MNAELLMKFVDVLAWSSPRQRQEAAFDSAACEIVCALAERGEVATLERLEVGGLRGSELWDVLMGTCRGDLDALIALSPEALRRYKEARSS